MSLVEYEIMPRKHLGRKSDKYKEKCRIVRRGDCGGR